MRHPRRGRALQVVLFLVAALVWLGVGFVLAAGATHLATERVYLSQVAMDLDLARSGWIAGVTWGLYAVASLAVTARAVGYRVRDGLLVLVPFYGYYFPFKMLWRWASLPDRYWEDRPPWPESPRPSPPPTNLTTRRAGRLLMVLGIGVIAVVAFALLDPAVLSSGSAAERWETVRHRGMSIDLPTTYEVTTDVEDFRQAILELGLPNAEETAEVYRRFPEFFVLAAIDVSTIDGSPDGWSTTVVVQRFPAPSRSVAETADLYESSASESGFEVVDRHEVVLDPRYEAIRLEIRGIVPPLDGAPSIDYVIQAGAEVWVIEFSAEPARFSAHIPTFERMASTIRLP